MHYGGDIEYICHGLFTDDEYLKRIINGGHLLPVGFIKTAEKYIRGFNKRVNNIIDSHLETYIGSLASKGVSFSMGHLDYSKKNTQRMLKIFLGLSQNHYSEILKSCPETPIHVLGSFFRYLNALQSKDGVSPPDKNQLEEFEKKLLDDLTNIKNKYNIWAICLNEETDLDYLKSFMELTKNKKPDFFNKILEYIASPGYNNNLARRLLYTFSHNPQFMINFFNFLDVQDKSSIKFFRMLLSPKYRNEFRKRFYERLKEKEKQSEFLNLLINKYPDFYEDINNLLYFSYPKQ